MTDISELIERVKAGDSLEVVDDRPTVFKMPVPFRRGDIVTVKSVWVDGCIELVEHPPGSGAPAAAFHPDRFTLLSPQSEADK